MGERAGLGDAGANGHAAITVARDEEAGMAQEAAVANARVSLGYTNIKSPIDGQTGALSVKVGSLVTANQTELTTIARVQPVYVTFSIPAVHLSTIKSHMAGGKLPVSPRVVLVKPRRWSPLVESPRPGRQRSEVTVLASQFIIRRGHLASLKLV